jgi:hypothetical protein
VRGCARHHRQDWTVFSRSSLTLGCDGTTVSRRLSGDGIHCSTSGDSWADLGRGWLAIAGCARLTPCSGRCASTASSLEREQGEEWAAPPSDRCRRSADQSGLGR